MFFCNENGTVEKNNTILNTLSGCVRNDVKQEK